MVTASSIFFTELSFADQSKSSIAASDCIVGSQICAMHIVAKHLTDRLLRHKQIKHSEKNQHHGGTGKTRCLANQFVDPPGNADRSSLCDQSPCGNVYMFSSWRFTS